MGHTENGGDGRHGYLTGEVLLVGESYCSDHKIIRSVIDNKVLISCVLILVT